MLIRYLVVHIVNGDIYFCRNIYLQNYISVELLLVEMRWKFQRIKLYRNVMLKAYISTRRALQCKSFNCVVCPVLCPQQQLYGSTAFDSPRSLDPHTAGYQYVVKMDTLPRRGGVLICGVSLSIPQGKRSMEVLFRNINFVFSNVFQFGLELYIFSMKKF